MTTVKPSMKLWEDAWVKADAALLLSTYATAGVMAPPNSPLLKGLAITDFLSGGFAAIEVRFFPEELLVADTLAFELGTVRDFARGTEQVVETCHYAVTWALEGGQWKIKYHTWTIPLAA